MVLLSNRLTRRCCCLAYTWRYDFKWNRFFYRWNRLDSLIVGFLFFVRVSNDSFKYSSNFSSEFSLILPKYSLQVSFVVCFFLSSILRIVHCNINWQLTTEDNIWQYIFQFRETLNVIKVRFLVWQRFYWFDACIITYRNSLIYRSLRGFIVKTIVNSIIICVSKRKKSLFKRITRIRYHFHVQFLDERKLFWFSRFEFLIWESFKSYKHQITYVL